ncbi:MAG: T9SS type A sorting domain-containing protein [Bacteroidetes bacterium]|nr:T9SS type A sorting domain-containing protein [Bacteroidota bacterium]
MRPRTTSSNRHRLSGFIAALALMLAIPAALGAATIGGEIGGSEGPRAVGIPARVFLDQNYPNPFNPSTLIRFGLPEGSYVRLTIHTLLGTPVKVVVDGWQDAGVYVLDFSAQDLPSGVYFYRLETDFGTLTRRMTISK